MTGLIVALDTADLDQAMDWVLALYPHVDLFKVGLELFSAHGLNAVKIIQHYRPVMLDLKLHDIPTTVGKTVRVLATAEPKFITVHAAAYATMLQSYLSKDSTRTQILVVLSLTSRYSKPVDVHDDAFVAGCTGADGFVAGGRDVTMLKNNWPDAVVVVLGVRLEVNSAGDHRKPITPFEAARDGADYIVVGRPITEAGSFDQMFEAVKLFQSELLRGEAARSVEQ